MAVAEISFDLKQLPIRAMLAHASRCARRVQPLFVLDPNHPDTIASRKAIDSAIRLAEGFAAGNEIDPLVVSQIEEITVHALLAASTDAAVDKRAAYAANSAYAVINATRAALAAEQAADPSEAVARVVEACVIATESAISADEAVERGARLDWEMLHRMRLGKFPDFGEPINPVETGMLGPLCCLKARATQRRRPEHFAPHRVGSSLPNDFQNPENGEQTAANGAERKEKIKRSIAKLRVRQQKVRSQRQALEADRSAFLAELQALETQRQSVSAERSDLSHQLEDAHTRKQSLESELNALSDRVKELESQQADFERQRDELLRECEQLREKNARLERLQAETLAASEGSPDRNQANLQRQSDELAGLKAQLEARQADLVKAAQQAEGGTAELARLQQQFHHERASLEQQRAELQRQNSEFHDRSAQLEQRQQSLEEQQVRVKATASKIAAVRKRLEQRRNRLAEQRSALLEQREVFQVEKTRLEAAASELAADRSRFATDRQQLEAAKTHLKSVAVKMASQTQQIVETQARLHDERAQFEAQREELQRLQGVHQAAVAALLEDKTRLEQKELKLAQSLEEFNATRREANAADHVRGPCAKPEAGTNQDGLSALVQQLRDERQRLQAERREVAEMISELNASRRQKSQNYGGPTSADPSAAHLLTFLLDPGSASARQLSGVFSALSQLYQALGGPGLVFEVRACRVWSYGESRSSSRTRQVSQRVFAQVQGRADESAARSLAKPDPALWDRFVSSVMTAVGLDSALADHFNLGEDVGHDHPATAAVCDAVALAANAAQSDDPGQHRGLSIDAITQQMRRLESLRRKLEEQHQMKLELSAVGGGVEAVLPDKRPVQPVAASPKVAPPIDAAATKPPKKRWRQRFFAIGGLIAVIVVIVGMSLL
ncbi:MAG: hypothetical protein WD648_03160 [Planctomycetaceae bacterium]